MPRGFELSEYGKSFEGHPLFMAARTLDERLPAALIVGGTHGDEPAGVLAATRYLSLGDIPPWVNLIIYPCLNPDGLRRNSRTTAEGFDLNREFNPRSNDPASTKANEAEAFLRSIANWRDRVDLLINLHEDNPCVPTDFGQADLPSGAYIYFHSNKLLSADSAPISILNSWKKSGVRIANDENIYGDCAKHGLVDYALSSSNHALREVDLLDNYLKSRDGACSVTIETLVDQDLEERVAAHLLAIQAAIESLSPIRGVSDHVN